MDILDFLLRISLKSQTCGVDFLIKTLSIFLKIVFLVKHVVVVLEPLVTEV